MSDYGYWIVTYSVAPHLRLSVLVCKIGITSSEAVALVAPVTSVTPVKG